MDEIKALPNEEKGQAVFLVSLHPDGPVQRVTGPVALRRSLRDLQGKHGPHARIAIRSTSPNVGTGL